MLERLMESVSSSKRVVLIPVADIRPNRSQPRQIFDDEAISSLAASIAEHGVLQPISLRRAAGGYELIAGERRLRAAKLAGLSKIPSIVMEASDEQSSLFALIENLMREDLSFFEEAAGIARLIEDFGLTQAEAAERLSMGQSTVANKLRLLRLSQRERDVIIKTGMTERHARALLKIQNEEERLRVLCFIANKGMNVKKAEDYIDLYIETKSKPKPRRIMMFRDMRIFVNTINHALSVMQQAGIPASYDKNETHTYIEYVIKIPKEHYKPLSQATP